MSNFGTILVEPTGSVAGNGDGNGTTSLKVTQDNYDLAFSVNGGSGTAPATEYVYADTLQDAGMTLPAGPSAPGQGAVFAGWYTAATGGTEVTDTTDLNALLGSGPTNPNPVTLYAHYTLGLTSQPSSASVQALGSVTFSAAAANGNSGGMDIAWESCPASDPDGCAPDSTAWTTPNDPTNWSVVSNQNTGAGTATTTLKLSDLQYAQNGTEYRAVFSGNGTVDSAAATLTVTQIPQAITFTPLSSPVSAGTTQQLSASSATSTASGQPVVFSVDPSTAPSDTCSVSGSKLTLAHAGSCVVDASEAASSDGNYAAASTSQTVDVQTVGTDMSLPAPPATVYGQSQQLTATVSEADGAQPDGSVQFTLDGQNLGSPVSVGSDGTATSPDLGTLAPGRHAVTASFTPTDPSVYSAAAATVTAVVDQAASTTTIAVKPHAITASVAAAPPGQGTPSGSVTFSVDGKVVGSATLSSGSAQLAYTVPVGATQQVSAVYGGDTDFSGSSASTARSDPSIAAHLTSAHPKTRYGWFRSPVTVSFTCTTHGAPLTARCPRAVKFTRSRAGQSVTRTITATNGGVATVVVSGINIDRRPPAVRVTGAHAGSIYDGTAPQVHCVAHALSGIASCRIRTRVTAASGTLETRTVHYAVTAVSRSGLSRTVSGRYRVLGIYVEDAPYQQAAFQIRPGRSYTIVVQASRLRPRYIDAAPVPGRPMREDQLFFPAGHDRWVIGVALSRFLFVHYRTWSLGVQIGAELFQVDVHAR